MKFNEATRILNGSFDAGFLVRADGDILHINPPAHELFAIEERSVRDLCDSYLRFWTPLEETEGDQHGEDTMMWHELVSRLLHGEERRLQLEPEEEEKHNSHFHFYQHHTLNRKHDVATSWSVTGLTNEDTSFPGTIKVVHLRDDDEALADFFMIYVRHNDLIDSANHTDMPSTGYDGSVSGSAPSTKSGFRTMGRKPKPSAVSFAHADQAIIPEVHILDSTTDPMMAIDEDGTVLMFNHAAVEKVPWCKEDLVGRHLGEGLDLHAKNPTMTVDNCGRIMSVNEAAMMNIPWFKAGTGIGDNIKAPLKSLVNKARQGLTHQTKPRDSQTLRIFVAEPNSELASLASAGHGNRDAETAITSVTDAHSRENVMDAIIEASLDPLFQINEAGIIQMVNSAAVKQFGWT